MLNVRPYPVFEVPLPLPHLTFLQFLNSMIPSLHPNREPHHKPPALHPAHLTAAATAEVVATGGDCLGQVPAGNALAAIPRRTKGQALA